jgi:phage minor structural protein
MLHPVDPDGAWQFIQTDAIIKAPIPVRRIKNALSGLDADIYTVNANGTALRESASEPTPISYMQWTYLGVYSVGDKVSYLTYGNYQCISDVNEGTPYFMHPPNNEPGAWKKIASQTSGAPILATLTAGTELIYIEDAQTTGWIKVMTVLTGITGYIKLSQVTFDRHQDPTPIPDRVITEQLFRIYRVDIDSNSRTVSVSARHVSYDLNGVLMQDCDLNRVSPSMAIMLMQEAWMIPYRGTIATNLSTDNNGTYTGNVTNKSGTAGFLDPDLGMVNYFHAQLIRDNWDIFLMANNVEDRGFRIRYGVNMKGVKWSRDIDRVVNRVVPVAKTADGSDLYLPEQWVDSPNLSDYSVIHMERLSVKGQIGKDDGSGTGTNWTEETLLAEMRTKAGERFSVDHADAGSVKLTVDFLRLGDTEEYQQYRGLEEVSMYDQITVQAPQIGLDMKLQVSRIRYDCILGRFLGIEVGDVFDYNGNTVSGYQIGNGAIYYEKISQSTIDRIRSEL